MAGQKPRLAKFESCCQMKMI